MKNCGRYFRSFLAGQAVQMIILIIGWACDIKRTIAWSAAAGSLIALAVMWGVWIACRDFQELENERKAAEPNPPRRRAKTE